MSLRVGIVGIGFMGWIHWLAWQQQSDAKVTAIVSRSKEKRAGDWTSIQGNFGPPGEQVDLSGVQVFETVEEMLASDCVDLVDICLPPSFHRSTIEQAANANRHVFCEKPLCLNLQDCDAAAKSCVENGVKLFVGQVLPFFLEFKFAAEKIRSGEYGKLIGGHFKRVVSDPSASWIPDFFDREVVGGPLLDLHVHDAHLIRWLFGMPKTVYSGGRLRDGVVEYCNSIFTFEDPSVTVAAHSGTISQQGRPFNHAFEIHLERATICFEFAAYTDRPETLELKILDENGDVIRPEDLGDPDPVHAFTREIEELMAAIEGKPGSNVLSGDIARDAILICESVEQSIVQKSVVALS